MINKILSKKNSVYIKGISAIMICISHIVNENFPPYFRFLKDGSLWVGIFLFFTGYGLLYSYNNKEGYLDDFIKNKFLKLYIPTVIAEIIYIVLYTLFFGYKFNYIDILWGIFCIKNINTAFWYIQLTLIIYLLFYIIFKNKKIKKKISFLTILYLFYMIIMIILDKLIGVDTWWYLSISCLIFGFYVESFKNKVDLFLKCKWINLVNSICIVVSIIMLILLNNSLINEYNFLNINNNYFIISIDIILNPIFCFIIVYNFGKFDFQSKILKYFGTISTNYYYYHRLAIKTITEKLNIDNCYFQLLLILILTTIICEILRNIKKGVLICKKKLML